MTKWLGERGAANSVEKCRPRVHSGCLDSVVSRHWWWPFANNSKKPAPAPASAAAAAKGRKRGRGR